MNPLKKKKGGALGALGVGFPGSLPMRGIWDCDDHDGVVHQ